MADDKERILAVGVTEYIEKPINPDTFISQLQEYLPPSQSRERGWLK
jgi:two-component system cell cycle response regulator DivK